MTLENARKQALFAGITLIVTGSVSILVVVLIYALSGNWLNSYSQQEPNPATNVHLVKAVKVAAYRLVPAYSVIMIASGASILIYCTKQKDQMSRQKGVMDISRAQAAREEGRPPASDEGGE
jgi:Mn2+/Fe2+ NRAMP family transporter